MELAPDPRQSAVLAHREGPMLVLGGPGTGKTLVLRERLAGLVESGVEPGRVALFVLTRRAAREARDWLLRRLRRSMPEIAVFTAHGFAFRVLGARFRELDYEAPPHVLSAPEQYGMVREMLLEEDPADWPTLGRLLDVPGFAREVADFVLRAQERLLDPDALEALAERAGAGPALEAARFYRRYLDTLAPTGQTDFAGLLQQAVTLLSASPADGQRFDHVMVDDYQDATFGAEAVLSALVPAARSVVVAADPDGHVFSYRGGSLEPLRRLERTLGPHRTVALATSHRLGPAIHGLLPLSDPDVPAGPAPNGMEARLFAHPGEEVEGVARELMRLRVDEDVAWSDMAVVLRHYGGYLTALRHALNRHGIPHLVVAEASELAGEPVTRAVLDLLRYVFRPATRGELVERVLGSPIGGFDPHGLRRLRRHARLLGRDLRSLADAGPGSATDIGEAGSAGPDTEEAGPSGDAESDGARDGAGLPPDLAEPLEAFRRLLVDVPRWAEEEGPAGMFFRLWERLPLARHLVSADDAEARRELDALVALGEALRRFAERRPGATVEDYLEALDAAEFGPDPWIPPEERAPSAVRVVSAHRAQGLEYRAVLVVGCLEGEFPSLRWSQRLVDVDAVLEPATPAARLAARLAEERALFRLAVSRAPRTVLFASRSTGARNPRSPSRFAARLGLSWSDAPRAPVHAVSLRGMESTLRARLADRREPAAGRLAAAACLPLVGARPERWWGRRDWSDPGEPLYPAEVRTSYSRLSTLDNCALQYLYQVEMGLDPEASHSMWVGSVIHDIIDRVQRREIERTEPAVHEALDRAWRPGVFPSRAVEHRRYLDARGMLSRWLEQEHEAPLRSEVPFEFALDGAVIRGRIDAIFPMENGHVRVVDYKTGRNPPSQAEVKEDLQLASYYLAVKRSEDLRGLGEPGYLQLAYLGAWKRTEPYARRGVSPKVRDDYEAWAAGRILGLVARIRDEAFAPSAEANCQWCTFRTICPIWPEGGEAPV